MDPSAILDGSAFTAQLSAVADAVSTFQRLDLFGSYLSGTGEWRVGGIANFVFDRLILIVDAIALFVIIRSGIRLISRAADEQMQRSKRLIVGAIVAIMLAHLVPKLVEAFIGFSGIPNFEIAGAPGAPVFIAELSGIIKWVEVLLAATAVAMIIVSGLRAVVSWGSEEGTAQLRRTVMAVAFGMLIVVIKFAIMAAVGVPTETSLPGTPVALTLVDKITDVVKALLTFVGVIAIGIIVYAGFMMIVNIGSEDRYQQNKNLVIRSAFGLLIIVLSYVIIRLVVDVF
jgi:hypothetical protein